MSLACGMYSVRLTLPVLHSLVHSYHCIGKIRTTYIHTHNNFLLEVDEQIEAGSSSIQLTKQNPNHVVRPISICNGSRIPLDQNTLTYKHTSLTSL